MDSIHPDPGQPRSSASSDTRTAGVILVATSVLMVGFMAMHPTAHTHELAGFAAEAASGSVRNGIVHGALIAIQGVMLLALLGLADRLGMRRPMVRAGIIAYGAGAIAGMAAATINGFIVPGLAAKYVDTNPATLEQLRPMLVLCMVANGVCSRIDVVGVSGATVLWAIVLAHFSGSSRVIGVTALVCGIVPLAALTAGRLPMNLHGFGAFVLLQAIWCIAAGLWLIRGGATRAGMVT